jgi:hypothetical protein
MCLWNEGPRWKNLFLASSQEAMFADLTMPEAAPGYHAVIETVNAEFVNGTRLLLKMVWFAYRKLKAI